MFWQFSRNLPEGQFLKVKAVCGNQGIFFFFVKYKRAVRVSTAVLRHHEQKQLGEERPTSAHSSISLSTAEGRPWRSTADCLALLLSLLLKIHTSQDHLGLGVALPTLGWASHTHHWSRKCPTDLPTGQSLAEAYLSSLFPDQVENQIQNQKNLSPTHISMIISQFGGYIVVK